MKTLLRIAFLLFLFSCISETGDNKTDSGSVVLTQTKDSLRIPGSAGSYKKQKPEKTTYYSGESEITVFDENIMFRTR